MACTLTISLTNNKHLSTAKLAAAKHFVQGRRRAKLTGRFRELVVRKFRFGNEDRKHICWSARNSEINEGLSGRTLSQSNVLDSKSIKTLRQKQPAGNYPCHLSVCQLLSLYQQTFLPSHFSKQNRFLHWTLIPEESNPNAKTFAHSYSYGEGQYAATAFTRKLCTGGIQLQVNPKWMT